MDPVVVAFGLGVGVLIGLTGIGGGSLMTPLLVIVVGTNPVVAVGTDLAYGAVTKTLGGFKHLRKGTVDLGVSNWLAFGSLPGALLGVLSLSALHHAYGKGFDTVLLACVAGALFIVAGTILFRAMFMPRLVERERHSFAFTTRSKVGAVVMGFLLGALLGLTSVGSGALIGLALIGIFRLTPHRVVGTSVFHAALLLWVAALAHLAVGNVDFGLMGTILIGSIPGVWIGTALSSHVPANALRPALGAVVLGSGLAVASKAGLHIPVGVIFGAPVAVGLAALVNHRLRLSAPPASGQPGPGSDGEPVLREPAPRERVAVEPLPVEQA
ncbi:MAG: sulfite exporter TauE/SafE family protein [Actinobacteria bacterium]|nr:MAG: sulfite exporter TauE/SafE family protein [Actinomycetota bacterium]